VNVKKRLELLEKKIGLDSYSLVPVKERVIMISGDSKEDCEAKMNEKLAAMHRKYGRFDESVLTIILIPFVPLCKDK
jgi:hypothetical protein